MRPSRKFIAGILAFVAAVTSGIAAADLSDGFTQDKLQFKVQFPYDLKESDRYAVTDGVYHLWVLNTDKPFNKTTKTLPRTEMRFPDYTSGAHQFEADMMVPAGTDAVTIMQIHTGDSVESQFGPVAYMFQVHHGALHSFNDSKVLLPDCAGKWFHLNVIQDVKAGTVQVYINGDLADTVHPKPAGDFYYKCGVYECRGGSAKMEVYIKNLKMWTKEQGSTATVKRGA